MLPGIEQESAITGLRAFFSGFPIVGTLIAMYVMRNYDVTEEKALEIRAAINRKKAEKNWFICLLARQTSSIEGEGIQFEYEYRTQF